MLLVPLEFFPLLLPTPHRFPDFQPNFLPSDQGEIWDSFSCWVKIFPVITFRIPFDPGVPGWAPEQMCDI